MTLLTRFARSSLKIAKIGRLLHSIGVWWSIPGGLYPAHVWGISVLHVGYVTYQRFEPIWVAAAVECNQLAYGQCIGNEAVWSKLISQARPVKPRESTHSPICFDIAAKRKSEKPLLCSPHHRWFPPRQRICRILGNTIGDNLWRCR